MSGYPHNRTMIVRDSEKEPIATFIFKYLAIGGLVSFDFFLRLMAVSENIPIHISHANKRDLDSDDEVTSILLTE